MQEFPFCFSSVASRTRSSGFLGVSWWFLHMWWDHTDSWRRILLQHFLVFFVLLLPGFSELRRSWESRQGILVMQLSITRLGTATIRVTYSKSNQFDLKIQSLIRLDLSKEGRGIFYQINTAQFILLGHILVIHKRTRAWWWIEQSLQASWK